jgi:hypothetical protein
MFDRFDKNNEILIIKICSIRNSQISQKCQISPKMVIHVQIYKIKHVRFLIIRRFLKRCSVRL